jgi:chromate transporter
MSAAETPLAYRGRHSLTRAWEVLKASLQLGLTSFGGPIAHLGYFEQAYVHRRQWLTGAQYASLVALCQVVPGPASSQVGFLIGLHRAGWLGALAAWIGFTAPSALLLYAAARYAAQAQGVVAQAAVHGLKLVAVAIVAQAVWSMAQRLCPNRRTTAIALGAATILLVAGGTVTQMLVLALGAATGILLFRHTAPNVDALPLTIGRGAGWAALSIFLLLLVALPIVAAGFPHSALTLADIFYRAGALVFGGGHVVLPLLRDALVPAGWISDANFLTGYGLAQAVPGPLFTFAAYLGAANAYTPTPATGAIIALVLLFLPGLLVAIAGASLWASLARHAPVRAALVGLNATVVGILGAALYDPVWTTAIRNRTDAAIAVAGWVLLEKFRWPPVGIVLLCVALSLLAAVTGLG